MNYYDVVIRRNVDGEERTYRMDVAFNPNLFWWTRGDGSGGCDCNRGAFFAEAGGEDDPDHECSHEAFDIVRFILSNGTVIDGAECQR